MIIYSRSKNNNHMSKLYMLNINNCMGKRLRSGDYGTGDNISLDNGKGYTKRSGYNVYDLVESYGSGSGGSTGGGTFTGSQPSNPSEGTMYWDGEKMWIYSGNAWQEVSGGGGGGGVGGVGELAAWVYIDNTNAPGRIKGSYPSPGLFTSNSGISLTYTGYGNRIVRMQNNTGSTVQTIDNKINLSHGAYKDFSVTTTTGWKFTTTTHYTYDFPLFYSS